MISIAGPLMNVFLAAISFFLLFHPRVRKSTAAFSFLFWLALTNVAQVWSYIPLRSVLYESGDLYWFETALEFFPWVVTLVGTVLITAAFALLFISILPFLSMMLGPTFPERTAVFCPGLVYGIRLVWHFPNYHVPYWAY
jgi:hypothetical protein